MCINIKTWISSIPSTECHGMLFCLLCVDTKLVPMLWTYEVIPDITQLLEWLQMFRVGLLITSYIHSWLMRLSYILWHVQSQCRASNWEIWHLVVVRLTANNKCELTFKPLQREYVDESIVPTFNMPIGPILPTQCPNYILLNPNISPPILGDKLFANLSPLQIIVLCNCNVRMARQFSVVNYINCYV